MADTCWIEERGVTCGKPVKVKGEGVCHMHDMRFRRTGNYLRHARQSVCTYCGKPAKAGGLCGACDMQRRRTGGLERRGRQP